MEVVGEAKTKNIKRTCCSCHKEFLMTCMDYIFNKCGVILVRPHEGKDDWVCNDCVEQIEKVKNL